MVTRIRQQWPDAELTWVIGKIEYQLVQLIPDVRFVVFDKSEKKQAVKKLRSTLRDDHFDVLLMMQVALRANLASRVIRAKRRIGFDWARSKELHWLFTNERIAPRQHAHVIQGFMGFADKLGVPETPLSWDIPLENSAREWAAAQADKLGTFVVISPAASKAARNWSADRYAEIAGRLVDSGYQTVVCGGPGKLDRELADAIKQQCAHQLCDLVGATTLHQMAALLSHARLVIAPDTGPAHIAAAMGTPVVGLYAHSNPRRTGPVNNLQHVVSVYDEVIEQQHGKTWHQLPWGLRARGEDLMQRISVDDVWQKIQQII
ncbi:glycosyltransferase family 9 protein [Salinimonas marina]|uniref:Glycosyltransferase family 9 protein n=2 Tax=Salinimonas marina TaxID=2785918 RepID=A0A7S9HF27_9ALTE|nr:glycosyltransferase family 9 protein [Salinimonas marina]QPG07276.1 glycosyltransferase family 9 protein [Salinimonas marina]